MKKKLTLERVEDIAFEKDTKKKLHCIDETNNIGVVFWLAPDNALFNVDWENLAGNEYVFIYGRSVKNDGRITYQLESFDAIEE